MNELASRKADERFAEVPTGQHADEGLRSFIEAVDYVFAIADSAGANSRADLPQEGVIVLVDEFGIDVCCMAASVSTAALRVAVDAISLRFGRRSRISWVSGVLSRITHTTSNGFGLATTAPASARWS